MINWNITQKLIMLSISTPIIICILAIPVAWLIRIKTINIGNGDINDEYQKNDCEFNEEDS